MQKPSLREGRRQSQEKRGDRMKLYLTGSVASGKSTLARQIAARTGIPCHSLDEVVYVPDPGAPSGNRKRPEAERDALFAEILRQPQDVLEDTGRACFEEGLRQADAILLLELPLGVRYKRIFTRWLRQNLGLEPCLYRPGWNMLKAMFRWAGDYDAGRDGTKKRVEPYREKTVILRSRREISAYLEALPSSGSENAASPPP